MSRVSSTTPPPPTHKTERRKNWIKSFHNLHPSHKGAYSVERLQALRKYRNKTSLLRVISVCITLPAPALLVTVLLECIPLEGPQDGWKANFGAWIRLGLIGFSISAGLIIETNEMVPLSKLSITKTLLVAMIASSLYLLLSCCVASAWVYPIPLGYIVLAPVFSTILVITFLMAIGPKKFRKNPMLGHQLRKQLGIIMVQTSMCCIYPAFSVLYFRLEPLQQTALIFVLPIIKIIIQSAVVWFSSHVEEYIPGITVFSVEVFNALYLTKCMQSAKSVVTFLAIMLFDVLEMVLAFVDMKGQISNLHQLQSQYKSSSTHDLLDTVLGVCKDPGVLEPNGCYPIKIRSSLKLRVLKSSVSPDTQTIEKSIQDIFEIPCVSLGNELVVDRSVSPVTKATADLAEKQRFVHHSLKVLFQCEYHVLVEYVESVIPMIYALYVAMVCELPSAKYYPETRDMTSKNVASMALNVMAYAWMEVLSLIALHFAVKRKFGISPIYVLAFVLENQAMELQARLTVWFAYILQLTLVHFGKVTRLSLELA